jgi:SRSO17 transposase
VFDKIACDADHLLKDCPQVGLLLDESAFAKKGTASAGVARQYNGRLGKVENSQVAVFGALCADHHATLIDAELYLPESWISDPERCEKVHIPAERLEHKSKLELALEIVARQRQSGIRFSYVCADGLYGNSFDFCKCLEDAGEKFLVHIHSNLRVFTKKPRITIPEKKTRGRRPRKVAPDLESVRVDELVRQVPGEDWERITVRKTTTGKLVIDAWRKTIWMWDEKTSELRRWLLFVRRDLDGELKYCLSNLPEAMPMHEMALIESRRFWIERAFENGKSEVGMADYQVRTWQGWHHHMALAMLAMLFMMKQRMSCGDSVPLLSCRDIREMLEHFLPKKSIRKSDVIERIEARHRRRKKAMISKAKKQAERLGMFP